MFADLADAAWMIQTSQTEQITWIGQVLADETRSDSLVLAVSKNQGVAELALGAGIDMDTRRVLVEWLCDAPNRIHLGEACLEAMLNTLIEEAEDAADWVPPAPTPGEAELFWS